MPDGRIEQRQINRLREIGQWLNRYGDTIYGTRGGPVPPQEWGVTTQKGNRIFVHVLNRQTGKILLPKWDTEIKSAVLFLDKSNVKMQHSPAGLFLQIPDSVTTDFVVVVELTI